MNKSKKMWFSYVVLLLIAVCGIVYMTHRVLKLEEKNKLEEKVRLALWRLVTMANDIVSSVSWKHPKEYDSEASDPGQDKYVFKHFQFNTNSNWESLLSEDGFQFVDVKHNLDRSVVANLMDAVKKNKVMIDQILSNTPPSDPQLMAQQEFEQQRLNYNTYVARSKYSKTQQAKQENSRSSYLSSSRDVDSRREEPQIAPERLFSNPLGFSFSPLFLSNQLVLARKIDLNNEESLVQRSLLDWETINQELVSNCQDLLPNVALLPSRATDPFERRMTSLPLTVSPPEESIFLEILMFSENKQLILLSWLALFVSLAGSALLIHKSNNLSKRKSTFVSAVTHELRTPLTTFRLYCDLLLSGKLNREKTDSYLNTMSIETERLTHMVENVLAFSRMEKTNVKSGVHTFDIDNVLMGMVESLENRCTKSDVSFSYTNLENTAVSYKAFADPAVLEHIVYNLVDNACKYGQNSENNSIQLLLKNSANKWLVEVVDNGTGIWPSN